MLVKDLINQLSKLVDINPKIADIEIKWYDDATRHLCRGDGLPIQLFQNIYTKEIKCVLNAIDNPPAYGMKAISNKHI